MAMMGFDVYLGMRPSSCLQSTTTFAHHLYHRLQVFSFYLTGSPCPEKKHAGGSGPRPKMGMGLRLAPRKEPPSIVEAGGRAMQTGT
eukprot:8011552-Pyramimonas_sp.AAC.1